MRFIRKFSLPFPYHLSYTLLSTVTTYHFGLNTWTRMKFVTYFFQSGFSSLALKKYFYDYYTLFCFSTVDSRCFSATRYPKHLYYLSFQWCFWEVVIRSSVLPTVLGAGPSYGAPWAPPAGSEAAATATAAIPSPRATSHPLTLFLMSWKLWLYIIFKNIFWIKKNFF